MVGYPPRLTFARLWFVLGGLVLCPSADPARSQSLTHDEMRSSAVELFATVSETAPHITLQWNPGIFPVTGITVYRRLPGSGDWGSGTSLPATATSHADTTAAPGVLYEYRVVRTHDHPGVPVAEGHLWSGVNVPPVESRGRLILIVESGIAAPLATEIARLTDDLTGDGWTVVRSDVARTDSVPSVKAAILAHYQADPGATRAVFLLGRIPVPYSGIVCPDGHYDPPPDAHHRGAWPADVYYGDMDGVWTDSTVNYTTANVDGTRNHNIPGDGKFDQSLIVGEHLPELAVGRVDLSNLSWISNGVSETNLIRRYLNRHHDFRHRLSPFTTLANKVMIDDNFSNAFNINGGASGWSSGIALVGNANTSAQSDWVGTLRDQSHLIAYGSGPGSFGSAWGVSSNIDFRDTRCRAVITLLFGSFFGDWDSSDNYLRAALMGTTQSHGLVSLWSGIPRWQLFPLAAGGTMADAYHHVLRESNLPGGPFPPHDDSWTNPDQTHVALMGDPVLRIQPVKPVSSLSGSASADQVTLTWSNPLGESDLRGSLIYRAGSASGPWTRVAPQTAPGTTSHVDTVPAPGIWHYMVRSVKRQATASATYDNPGQGIFTTVTVPLYGYAAWAQGLPDPAAEADVNGDGVTNLFAYAAGAADGHSPALGLLPTLSADGSGYTVPASGRSDIHYAIQLSTDLAQWYTVAAKPAGGTWSLLAGSGYPHQAGLSLNASGPVTVTDPGPEPRRFWRLKVSQ